MESIDKTTHSSHDVAVYLGGIGLCGPGLSDWKTSYPILTGQQRYQPARLPPLDRVGLPRNEARRASLTVRLALHVAAEAITPSRVAITQCRAVFACSGGNTAALDAICQALIQPDRPVSPNQFNNSVHNAPLGYWHIATGSMQPANSIGAYDASFAAGLLDAFSLIHTEQQPVVLVAFDTPPPRLLQPFRSVSIAFAVALLLTPLPLSADTFRLSECRLDNRAADTLPDTKLEQLRLSNPAARSLPLLQNIARKQHGRISLPYLSGKRFNLRVDPVD